MHLMHVSFAIKKTSLNKISSGFFVCSTIRRMCGITVSSDSLKTNTLQFHKLHGYSSQFRDKTLSWGLVTTNETPLFCPHVERKFFFA